MKFLTIVSCGLIAAGIALPAGADSAARETGFAPWVQAQAQGQGMGQGMGQRGGQGQGLVPRRGADQPLPQRDARGTDENERGRMSPEERRQLRRDIQDAGKDIYRPSRQAPMERGRSGRR